MSRRVLAILIVVWRSILMRRFHSYLVALFLIAFSGPAFADDSKLFLEAANKGDVAKVRKFLASGVDVNAKTEYGGTALAFACDRGNVELAKLLIENGADVDTKDSFYSATPMSWAMMHGHLDILELLVNAGATVESSLLMMGIQKGHVGLVKAMINSDSMTKELLNKGLKSADPDLHKEMIDLLVAAGAKQEAAGEVVVPAETLALYAGEYLFKQAGMKFKIRAEDGNIKGVVAGQPEITYAPKNQTTFESVEYPGISLIFEVKDGKCTGMRSEQQGANLSWERVAADKSAKEDSPADVAPVLDDADITVKEPMNWPRFRGPGGSGVADGQHPPIQWNGETGQNVRWKTKVPGFGHASPILWGDRIFVTTAVNKTGKEELKHGLYGDFVYAEDYEDTHSWQVFCLSRKTGEVLWSRVAHEGTPRIKRHTKSSHSDSTPVTDGKHVVACLGSEGLFCYDVEGNLLWKKDVGLLDAGWFYDPEYQFGFGSSPIIYNGLVILQADIQETPFLAAYELETGKTAWKVSRDEICSWSSPNIFEVNGRAELVTNGTKAIRAHDPMTGKELWRLVGNSEVCVPTPIMGHGLIYITSGYRPFNPIYAIRPGGNGDISLPDGESTNDFVQWSMRRGGPYMQTPVVYGDHLYTCADNGILACYDAKTGKRVYRQRLGVGRGYTASALAADGRLYFTGEDGDIVVAKAGPEYQLLSVNPMGEVCMSTPAISDGMMIVRTQHHVFGVGRTQATD